MLTGMFKGDLLAHASETGKRQGSGTALYGIRIPL